MEMSKQFDKSHTTPAYLATKKSPQTQNKNNQSNTSINSISEDISNYDDSANLNLSKQDSKSPQNKPAINQQADKSANKADDIPLKKNDSNTSIKSTPDKAVHPNKSPAKSEVKSEIRSEIQSEYENTFESLGDILKGSNDVFGEPININTLNELKNSGSKNKLNDELVINPTNEPPQESNINIDPKILKSAENPFSSVDTRDIPISSKNPKENLRYVEDEDDFSERNHESVHMPLGDEDDDVLDSNLNIMDTFDANDNLGGTFNKTLKGLDMKAMTLKSDADGSDSGSEEDCLGSERKLD